MKVFEVVSEYFDAMGGPGMVTTRQYVTATDDKLETVAAWFARECRDQGQTPVSVAEVLVVSQNIEGDK